MEETATAQPSGLNLREAALAFQALGREEETPTGAEDAEHVGAPNEEPVSDLHDEELAEEGIEGGLDSDEEDTQGEESFETEESHEELYTVRVAGRELEVPLSELLAGYSRTGDYLQKTERVADARKQIGQLQSQLEAERSEYKAVLPQLDQILSGFMASMAPDPALMTSDPGMYLQQKEAYEVHLGKIQAVQAEQARMAQLDQENFERSLQARLAQEQQLIVEAVPEWREPKVMQREQQELLDYGTTVGYSPEELWNVIDHRAVSTLRKAMLYDRARAQGRKKAKTAPQRTAKPGASGATGPTPGKTKREKAQWKRLAASGKASDAAPLMGALLGQ